MCSVLGCRSGRRRVKPQLFKLPEDPERRLQWVQFLAAANKQRFKESSWTDIAICRDHFKYDSFEVMTPRHSGKLQVSLKPGAVPSLRPRSGSQQLEAHLESLMCEEASTDYSHSSVTGIPEVVVAVIKEEGDLVDDAETSAEDTRYDVDNEESDVTEVSDDEGDMDSDEDRRPESDPVALRKGTDEATETKVDDPVLTKSKLCTECGMFFNKYRCHICEHKVKPFSCNTCGKRCISEVALKAHSRVHDDDYEHPCKYCHVTFRTKADKISHEQTHSTEEKPYKCSDCSETFASFKARRVHLVDHRGPRQLKCHICGIEFLRPRFLRRHSRVHTGEKPFKCSVCERGFNQAGHLKSHMRLHTGERPFKCQHCDKSFNHNVSLKSHVQRYHTSNSGGDGNKTAAGSALNSAEDKHSRLKCKRKGTGRPKGRPQRKESGNLVLTIQVEGQCSETKTRKQVQELNGAQCVDGEGKDEPGGKEGSFGSAEEKEKTSRKRQRNSGSDSDFDPKKRLKKTQSSQKSGQSSGKGRGRRRKNQMV